MAKYKKNSLQGPVQYIVDVAVYTQHMHEAPPAENMTTEEIDDREMNMEA